MRLLINYQNTKAHGEDFAITPFIFGVLVRNYKVIGIGFCWGWFSASLSIGLNVPKHYPTFKNLTH